LIDDQTLRSYYYPQILIECNYALFAAEDIDAILQLPRDERDSLRLRYCIDNFLIYAARISKFLWPSTDRIKGTTRKLLVEKRGEMLRKNLSIPENSPLKSKTVRNYLDHIDGELDGWVEYLKQPVGEKYFPSISGFNYTQKIFSIGSENVSLLPMIEAVKCLRKTIIAIGRRTNRSETTGGNNP
jgi:hypothetical protein